MIASFRASSPMAIAVLGSFLMGIAATGLLFAAYPYGLIAPDTFDYLKMGQSLFQGTVPMMEQARGPLLPLALALATHTSNPGAVILWMNGILFAFCLASIAWMCTFLFRRARSVWLFTGLLLLVEILINQPFIYISFALNDAPAAFLLCAGTILAVTGWYKHLSAALLLGFLCLGLSEAFRPMMLVPFFWGLAWVWMWLQRKHAQLLLAGCLIALLLPMGIWHVRNAVIYGKVRSNPFIAFHLMTHAVELWSEDDRIFDDPVINTAFHTALRTKTLPEEYKGPDFFYVTMEPYRTVFLFMSSQMPLVQTHGWQPDVISLNTYREEFAALIMRIDLQTFRRHPVKYMSAAWRKYQELYNNFLPRNYFQSFMAKDSKTTYARQSAADEIPVSLRKKFLPAAEWQSSALSDTAASFLFALSLPLHIRPFLFTAASGYFLAVHLCTVAALALFVSKRLRQALELDTDTHRFAWILMTVFFLTAFLHFAATAFLTVLQDVRYSSPGVIPCQLILFLAASLLLQHLSFRKK